MSKLPSTSLLPSTANIKEKTTKDWADSITRFLVDTIKKISAIPFNKSEDLEVADSGTADVEFSVTHHLLRIPEGFIITEIDKAGIIYDSGTTWTKTSVYLKCSAANAKIKLCVF